jgi:uncharacterized DUF497 family protein
VVKFKFVQWLLDWLLEVSSFSFVWDAGNQTKSAQKHSVTCEKAEQVFTECRFISLGEQVEPPCPEPRFAVLGQTASGRLLFLVFAIRGGKIRVISARPMNEKERTFYESLRQE